MNTLSHRIKLAIACTILLLPACATAPPRDVGVSGGSEEARFVREELYFGANRPGASVVTDSEWFGFLRDVVTPRFPAGLTVLRGYGQYRLEDGTIVEEGTNVIVLLYERNSEAAVQNDSLIGQIIAAYKRRFDQESVLRVRSLVHAAF